MADKRMEDPVIASLKEIYKRHFQEVRGKSCDLERSLPLREPFYCLKRVPRFDVRTDLHTTTDPAYVPLARTDSASIDDLTWKLPASCRKLLIEGDDGTGKTMMCFRLLHDWYEMKRKYPMMPEHVVYVNCSQSFEGLTYNSNQYKEQGLFEIISQSIFSQIINFTTDVKVTFDDVQSWLLTNANKVALIIDNVCLTSPLFYHACHLVKDRQLVFARLLIFTKPGLLTKVNFDCLFYSYGLTVSYSHRIFMKHLSKQYGEIERVVTSLLDHDPTMELFRNPLACSLLGNYMELCLWDNGMDIPSPRCRLDLLEALIHVSTSNLITSGRTFQATCTVNEVKKFVDILERLAFDAIQTGSSFIDKRVLPRCLQDQHMCDLHFMYEVHGFENSSLLLGFTSRCFRDYFASCFMCKRLESFRSGNFDDAFHKEVLSHRYSSLWSLCARSFYRDRNYRLLSWLIGSLMEKAKSQYTHSNINDSKTTRSGLKHLNRVLACLKETDFEENLTRRVCSAFPVIMEISCNHCPNETLQNFMALCAISSPCCQEVNVYWDRLNFEKTVSSSLSTSLNKMQFLTNIVVRATSIDDTDQFVRFVCGIFENHRRPTVESLTIGGPINAVHNISLAERKNILKVFSNPNLVVQKLVLENFNYHYRTSYILNCWPPIFEAIYFRKCSLDSAGKGILRLTENANKFRELSIEYSACPPKTLILVFAGIRNCHFLRVLRLNFLCTNRIVSMVYAKHPNFKTSFNEMVSSALYDVLRSLPNLSELQLCYDGIVDQSAKWIFAGMCLAHKLSYVDMTGNSLTDASVEGVHTVIHASPALKTLLLCENAFTQSGRKGIVKGSLDNKELRLGL